MSGTPRVKCVRSVYDRAVSSREILTKLRAHGQYVALLRKDPKSDFGVDFPDFPGCVTAGSSLEEARRMAEEALGFHVEGLLEDGEALPEPRTLDDVMTDPENREVVAFLVEIPQEPPRKCGST